MENFMFFTSSCVGHNEKMEWNHAITFTFSFQQIKLRKGPKFRNRPETEVALEPDRAFRRPGEQKLFSGNQLLHKTRGIGWGVHPPPTAARSSTQGKLSSTKGKLSSTQGRNYRGYFVACR